MRIHSLGGIVGISVLALAVFSPVSSPRPARAPAEITDSIGLALVLIPAGEFMMGSTESGVEILKAFPAEDEDAEFFDDELPRHKVRITRPFYVGKYEVTNAQFRAFVEATGYVTQAERPEEHAKGAGGYRFNQQTLKFDGRDPSFNWKNPGFDVLDDAPVVNVTYNDAEAFCDWLSKQESKKYRLPTEAEWEYAARAGTSWRYVSGDDPASLTKFGNMGDADFHAKFTEYYPKERTYPGHDGFALPAPVGKLQANAFGLYDVQGNVWEWTSDWYDREYYQHSPIDDPRGPVSGTTKARRGGSWHTSPMWSRIAFRNYNTVESRYPSLGFRVVREE